MEMFELTYREPGSSLQVESISFCTVTTRSSDGSDISCSLHCGSILDEEGQVCFGGGASPGPRYSAMEGRGQSALCLFYWLYLAPPGTVL